MADAIKLGFFGRLRRFQFSLLSLFVAITLFSLFINWQVRIVRQRKEMLAKIKRFDGSIYRSGDEAPSQQHGGQPWFFRRILGDEGIDCIVIPVTMDVESTGRIELSRELGKEISLLFPEAKFYVGISLNEGVHSLDEWRRPLDGKRSRHNEAAGIASGFR